MAITKTNPALGSAGDVWVVCGRPPLEFSRRKEPLSFQWWAKGSAVPLCKVWIMRVGISPDVLVF